MRSTPNDHHENLLLCGYAVLFSCALLPSIIINYVANLYVAE